MRDTDPTPVPPPAEMPVIDIVSVVGWTMRLRLHNGDSTRRRKPAGVQGAYVFTYTGETPPTDVNAWKFEGSTSKTETKIIFPTTLAVGTKIWLTAAWVNAKLQTGPATVPISTQINYGGLSQAA